MPHSLDANLLSLLTTIVTRGPVAEYAISAPVLQQGISDGYLMRINFEGIKVIATEAGYSATLLALGLKAPTGVARALEDLSVTDGVRNVECVRRLIHDATDHPSVQYLLWMTYHTDGHYEPFHTVYRNMMLSPNSAKDAAYYALVFIHGLRPQLTGNWVTAEGGLEASERYPNIRRSYDEEDGHYDYFLLKLTREVYCDPRTEETETVYADWDHRALTQIPPVPFVQYYADPNGRFPVSVTEDTYTPSKHDYETEFLESTLVLPKLMAQEVANEATRVSSASYNQYPANGDPMVMLKRMRRQVPAYLYDAVAYALRTKPVTPHSWGKFDLLPITVYGDTSEFYEVCWVIPAYKKRPLTVRRIHSRSVRVM